MLYFSCLEVLFGSLKKYLLLFIVLLFSFTPDVSLRLCPLPPVISQAPRGFWELRPEPSSLGSLTPEAWSLPNRMGVVLSTGAPGPRFSGCLVTLSCWPASPGQSLLQSGSFCHLTCPARSPGPRTGLELRVQVPVTTWPAPRVHSFMGPWPSEVRSPHAHEPKHGASARGCSCP